MQSLVRSQQHSVTGRNSGAEGAYPLSLWELLSLYVTLPILLAHLGSRVLGAHSIAAGT